MSSLVAHLAVSQPIQSPGGFVLTVEQWIKQLAYSQIDTADKRAALTSEVMDVYDSIATAASQGSIVVAGAFHVLRPQVAKFVASMIDAASAALAPSDPNPAPAAV